MGWHSLILLGLFALFAAAGAAPLCLMDDPVTLAKLESWQTWYGALLGFGGLIAVAYYNGAVDRARAVERRSMQEKALASTLAWEVYGLAHRSHWAHSELQQVVDALILQAEGFGWAREGPDDVLVDGTGHQALYSFVPEMVALRELVAQVGHLPGLAPKVAEYASLVTQARQVLDNAFEPNNQGQLSLRSLIRSVGWLQNVSDSGVALLAEVAQEFDQLRAQVLDLEKRAKTIDQNMPAATTKLVVDASSWTGRSG